MIIVGLIWSNVTVKTSKYTISDENIPEEFDGYTIVQISDLHNAEFGKDNEQLVKRIKKQEPNLIVLTGDIVDSNTDNFEKIKTFINKLSEIAPCYYVTGNHEAQFGKSRFNSLKETIEESGVCFLDNKVTEIHSDEDIIKILGFEDPDVKGDILEVYTCEDVINSDYKYVKDNIDDEIGSSFTIALSHRPEAFESYVKNGINVVFTGHAHGGQFRVPFVGGLIAPGQGLFPKYDAGVYSKENTHMVVSRGLGNSIIPIRINNRPELVVVTLKKK